MKKIQKVINKAPEKKPKKYFYSRLLESSFLLYIWSRLAKIVKSLDILRRPMTEEKNLPIILMLLSKYKSNVIELFFQMLQPPQNTIWTPNNNHLDFGIFPRKQFFFWLDNSGSATK